MDRTSFVAPKTIIYLRIANVLFLVIVAAVIGSLTYVILRNYESTEFNKEFNSAADLMSTTIGKNLNSKFLACQEFSSIFASSFEEQLWPNITLPGYHEIGIHLNALSLSLQVHFLPLVTVSKRKEFEAYASSNYDLLGYDDAGRKALTSGSAGWSVFRGIYSFNISTGVRMYDFPLDANTKYPFYKFPIWQVSPRPKIPEDNLWNVHSNKFRAAAIDAAIESKRPTFTDVILLYNGNVTSNPYPIPGNAIFCPIVGLTEARTVLGFNYFVFFWQDTIAQTLPKYLKGVTVVQTSPTTVYSYNVEGETITFLGVGDKHDSTFDSYKRVVETKDTGIVFRFEIYPTKEFQSQYITNIPMYSTMGVILVTLLTALPFLLYEYLVSARARTLTAVAETATAILENYIPSVIRERFFRHVTKASSEKTILKTPSKLSNMLKTITYQRDKNQKYYASLQSAPAKNAYSAHDEHDEEIALDNFPIADHFENVTVLFADVAGFTKWSSTHEPREVFDLLESLFAEFDKYASLRGVFKIETVGDWYLISYLMLVIFHIYIIYIFCCLILAIWRQWECQNPNLSTH